MRPVGRAREMNASSASESARKVPHFLFAAFFFLFARPTDLAEKIKITRGPRLSYKLHCGMHTGLVILRLEIY